MRDGYWYQFDTFIVIARKHGLEFEYNKSEVFEDFYLKFSDGNKHAAYNLPAKVVYAWHGLTRNELIEYVIEPMIDRVKKEISKL